MLMRFNILLILLIFSILATVGVYAQTTSIGKQKVSTISTCGNNICEEVKFILKEGESKTITVNGINHTFRLDRFDNGDFLSVDGSDPMGSSAERNIFMDKFQWMI